MRGVVGWIRNDGPALLRWLWSAQRHWLLLGLLLLIVMVRPIAWFREIWSVPESPLSYQPFVPLGILWLAMGERQAVTDQYRELVLLFPPDSPKRRGKLWPALAGCVLMVLAYLVMVPPLAMIALLLLISGIIYCVYGPYILGALRRPLGFLLAMSPIPNGVLSQTTACLQLGCAAVAGQVLHILNPSVRIQGTFIHLPGYTLEVAGPCSGVSVLFPVLAMTLWLILYKRIRLAPGLILLVIGAAISLLMNVLRIVAMGLIGALNPTLAQQLHDANSAAFTALAFYFTFLAAGILLRPWRLPWKRKSDLEAYGFGYYAPLVDPDPGTPAEGAVPADEKTRSGKKP